uniref:Uncharacterized protein n=1 Tax=Trypanosoma congolense (strain IL3000) TaxID=1068625 RepID=G0UZN4_TRYCI|nr:hypothetical protein, unlikely [Trypanosoma congolense IL3000]
MFQRVLHAANSAGGSLKGLTGVMNSLRCMLENCIHQAEDDSVSVTRAINHWEEALVGKVTELWDRASRFLLGRSYVLTQSLSNSTPRRTAPDDGSSCAKSTMGLSDVRSCSGAGDV